MADAVNVGAVLSSLIGPKEAASAAFPALSTQVPPFETEEVVPSVEIV